MRSCQQSAVVVPLTSTGHPNIVQLKEAYEDHVYVHLIMELCTGGDLVDRIMAKGRYTERDAAAVVRTMLKVRHTGTWPIH